MVCLKDFHSLTARSDRMAENIFAAVYYAATVSDCY
jgi:hypothetical protein